MGIIQEIEEESIGGRIHLLREILNLTQKEFAENIGLSSHVAVYYYEKNLRKPDLGRVLLISELGNTTCGWVLTGHVDSKACDKIIKGIKRFYSELRNEIIPVSITIDNKYILDKASKRLDLSPLYLYSVQYHSIDPSAGFIKRFCQDFNVRVSDFGDLSSKMGFDFKKTPPCFAVVDVVSAEEDDPMTEIIALLSEDKEAQKLVLKMLHSRNAMNEALSRLGGHKEVVPQKFGGSPLA